MGFIGQDMDEFRNEAIELLDSAERALLAIDKGESFQKYYDAIFKVFHSLKGGAGMMKMDSLQSHMVVLESIFAGLRGSQKIPKEALTMLLKAIDTARNMLKTNGAPLPSASAAKAAVAPPAQEVSAFTQTPVASAAPQPTVTPVASVKSDSQKSEPSLADIGEGKPRIYAIDDEQDILDIIQFELQQANMECHVFTDPYQLYEAVKKNPPDLVLTDMKMPICSGLEVLQAVRKMDPDLPVIFISGFLDKENLIESLDYGVFAAIEKPFNDKTLLNHVRNALRQRMMTKYLNRSINLILYQFSDIDAVLAEHGKDDIRRTIRSELSQLILFRRQIREFKQK